MFAQAALARAEAELDADLRSIAGLRSETREAVAQRGAVRENTI